MPLLIQWIWLCVVFDVSMYRCSVFGYVCFVFKVIFRWIFFLFSFRCDGETTKWNASRVNDTHSKRMNKRNKRKWKKPKWSNEHWTTKKKTKIFNKSQQQQQQRENRSKGMQKPYYDHDENDGATLGQSGNCSAVRLSSTHLRQ